MSPTTMRCTPPPRRMAASPLLWADAQGRHVISIRLTRSGR
jgi:hypothetical protein